MRATIVSVGNSRGIRIPKAVLEELGSPSSLELRLEGGELVLTPSSVPRQGWAEAARAAASTLEPLPGAPATDWDEKEWTW
ncbi:AbrB/MazE/SpoVT family DNA-binding domain-containing protein [Desulfolutivibrio sulfoxidireducens]|uniref:AbrB/MazE/SpoVT family DNA-binding domain-containing protein n=1 Tax=Desulfolutivibrio sulfoxidireducens TaxID=2773299 RepID=UPI00159EB14E|nr:AbrB/MazE/SpoVT family DNA-binding domain-containing protein [Desulfolutivibrio sulfoxidireducens]QLA17910.1 AbrB/MazE/SpoVT family DNA-binding domain-containing protein [Desulfolutivibrio sulfoxidireducens]QLA21490.1 AbrB/MazE/SpoVT family DNA-binding domain-containing protein [Desulfolutivibrio sulfoxidireducens]